LLASAPAHAPARVAIIRANAINWEDEQIAIMIRVEPDARNRWLIVAAMEGGVAVRVSLEQLDGEDAAITRWLRWSSLPAGEFLIVAALKESGPHDVARAVWPMKILARGPEP